MIDAIAASREDEAEAIARDHVKRALGVLRFFSAICWPSERHHGCKRAKGGDA
jgi:hypothetical protein